MASDVTVTNEWDEMARSMVREVLQQMDVPTLRRLDGMWRRVEHYKRGDSFHTIWLYIHGVPTKVRAECSVERVRVGSAGGPYFYGKVSILLADHRPPQPPFTFECDYSNDTGVVVRPVHATAHA